MGPTARATSESRSPFRTHAWRRPWNASGPALPRRRPQKPRQLGSESPLSATWRPAVSERAVVVGLARGRDGEALDELAALARAAGAEPVARVVQQRSAPDTATFVGKGKVGEIPHVLHATG